MSLRPKEIQFQPVFDQLSEVLDDMFDICGSQVSGIQAYQYVFDLCTARPQPFIDQLYQSLTNYLTQKALFSKEKILDAQHDHLILVYTQEFDVYATASLYTDNICAYLNKIIEKTPWNRAKARIQPKLKIRSLANTIWKEAVWLSLKIKHENILMKLILQSIELHRNNMSTLLQDIIKRAVESIKEMDATQTSEKETMKTYLNDFESPYLKETRNYYKRESAHHLSSFFISKFMETAIHRLEQEEKRTSYFCDSTSISKTMDICYHEYITEHRQELESQFESMVKDERSQDCSMIYQLLTKIPEGLTQILTIFEKHIVQLGLEFLKTLDGTAVLKDPSEYATKMINTQLHFHNIVNDHFASDANMLAAVDKAMRQLINDTKIHKFKSPEVLSKYCDILLRKSKSPLTEEEIEKKVLQAVDIFKYVDDKDIFQKFYSRFLAKRLIHGTFVSQELESNVIQMLKIACGQEYTNKLQRMFTDISISDDLNRDFQTFLERNQISFSAQVTVHILTTGSWPINPVQPTDFICPSEFSKGMDTFTTMYTGRHSGRKLAWQYTLCKGDVKFIGFDKRYEANLPFYHIIVLLRFNSSSLKTIGELKNETNLDLQDIIQIVKSFVNIQLFKVENEDLKEDSKVILNDKFESKKIKFKITPTSQQETPQETEQTRKAVQDDRKLFIQATIVRIMKSRQRLSHNLLITEVIEQSKSRFQPDIQIIKKAIEHLIERSYMDRDENASDVYAYVA